MTHIVTTSDRDSGQDKNLFRFDGDSEDEDEGSSRARALRNDMISPKGSISSKSSFIIFDEK